MTRPWLVMLALVALVAVPTVYALLVVAARLSTIPR